MRTFATVAASHLPPRAVATPRPFKRRRSVERLRPCGLSFAYRWHDGVGVRARLGLKGGVGDGAGVGQTRVAENLPAGFGGGEGGLRSLRDDRPLLLGKGGVQVQQERLDVGPRSATRNGVLCAMRPQMQCTSREKPIELGDGDRAPLRLERECVFSELDAFRKSIAVELRLQIARAFGTYNGLRGLGSKPDGPITARMVESKSRMPAPIIFSANAGKIGLIEDAMDVLIVYTLLEGARDGGPADDLQDAGRHHPGCRHGDGRCLSGGVRICARGSAEIANRRRFS